MIECLATESLRCYSYIYLNITPAFDVENIRDIFGFNLLFVMFKFLYKFL